MKKLLMVLAACATVTGCASRADSISASYVSPIQYEGYSCEQLAQEAERVSARVAELTGVQNDKATSDAVVTGVAIIVFWPAAFLVNGDGASAAELGRLKGEMEAIQKASIQKKCNIVFEAKKPEKAKPASSSSSGVVRPS